MSIENKISCVKNYLMMSKENSKRLVNLYFDLKRIIKKKPDETALLLPLVF